MGGYASAGLIAYDATSGELVWKSPAGGDTYSSPQLAEFDGVLSLGGGVVTGIGRVHGTEVMVVANDPTVKATFKTRVLMLAMPRRSLELIEQCARRGADIVRQAISAPLRQIAFKLKAQGEEQSPAGHD